MNISGKDRIFTGCAHPGILNTIHHAPKVSEGGILFVLGGSHLLYQNQADILEVVKEFKNAKI